MEISCMRLCAGLCIALALTASCSSGAGSPSEPVAQITTITLGPAVATDSYRPSGLPASWTGFCPVATPSAVTFSAGNGYQVVNSSGRSVELVTLPSRAVLETIAAGASGSRHVDFGAVSQSTFTYTLTVTGCTDMASGQGLVNVTVNSK